MGARRRGVRVLPAAASSPARRDGIFPAIWRVVSFIPRGKVATYGQIARMSGLGGGARTVGWAMRALPDGLTIGGRQVPWHRVINARGGISLRAPDGAAERQVRLLRRDRVPLGPGPRVDLASCLWDGVGLPVSRRPAHPRSRRGQG